MIKFICTGSNQRRHREFQLAEVIVGHGDGVIEMAEHTSFRPAERFSVFGGASSYDEFFCAKCRRNPRIDHDKFLALIRQLREKDIQVCDISHLPF